MLALLACSLSSCFKDEPANAECDIEAAWIHVDNPEEIFYYLTDTIVNVLYTTNLIEFEVKPEIDLTALAPIFKITAGAKIVPESGSVQDFSPAEQDTDNPMYSYSQTVRYKVTSEDGSWSREYDVRFKLISIGSSDTTTVDSDTTTVGNDTITVNDTIISTNDTILYSFENFSVYTNNYYVWNDSRSSWATGNAGYNLTGKATEYDEASGSYVVNPDLFPTVPVEGYSGYGVKLTTMDTGTFGIMVNMRLAAGNMFIGSFDASQALSNTLGATQFGEAYNWNKKPYKLRGYYKYERGSDYQDKNGNIVSDQQDEADIYAVFYRNHDDGGNKVVLNGEDVKTSQYIVAMAQVTDIEPTDEWTQFEAEFEFYDEIDDTLLGNRGYSLSIVFSSSVNGAYFQGAIGSTLMIDEVEFICTDAEE